MKKKLLVVALLSTLANHAFADDVKGAYIAVSGGSTASYTGTGYTIDAGSSYGVYLGYHFNPVFSLEGGYTSLLSNANLTSSGINAYTASISGAEIAGVFSFPVSQFFSPYLRVGSVSMSSALSPTSANVGGASSSDTLSGLTYGVGLQLNLNKRLGIRLGYSAYKLTDTTATPNTTMNLNNANGSIVYKF